MIRLISDTSTMYSAAQGRALGTDILPLSVTINQKSYEDIGGISTDDFIALINAGGIPTSSQPAIGKVVQCYEKYPDDEIVNLCMADGLSGTYLTALGARENLKQRDHIHVINTKTLCGPHRYMFDMARQMINDGCDLDTLLSWLDEKIKATRSFLMPQDFDFLRRGGRLTPLAARIGGLLKIQPVMIQTEDGRQLEKFATSRTLMGGANAVIKDFMSQDHLERKRIYICHANVLEQAMKIKEQFLKNYPQADIEIYQLTPVFVTQGGPGCISIQWIDK